MKTSNQSDQNTGAHSSKADTGKQAVTTQSKSKKGILIICILLLLLVIIMAGVIIYLMMGKEKEPEDTDGAYMMDESNYMQIMDQMTERVNEGNFETYMNTTWTFENGTAETLDAILGNSPNNTKPVRYEVQLRETGEMVLTTGVIPVGAALPPFKLDVDLEAGVYDAVCNVYLLQELEDGSYTDFSTAGFSVAIIVQN